MTDVPSDIPASTTPSAPATGTGSTGAGESSGPQTITATEGQYFCEFAAQRGFLNCDRWREVNPDLAEKHALEDGDEVVVPERTEGETADRDRATVESVRSDFPPAKVRFVGQNSSLGDRNQPGLTRLGISNYRTDKAGFNDHGHTHEFFRGEPAPDEDGRNANEEEVTTWNDPDHFRIEVHDVTAGRNGAGEVTVELQTLQPLYRRRTERGVTRVSRDETGRPDPDAPPGFRIPTNPDRKLEVTCLRVGETNYYRSKYLRLVTEEGDKIDGHTLFVGDYYQDGGHAAGGGGGGGNGGGGPNAGAIAGGAVAGAAVGGGAAALAVTQTDNNLSDEEKGLIIGGSAVAGAVAGGLIGHAASSGGSSDSASAAPAATPPTAEEAEDTRRYGEILDQQVRARYIPAMCTQQICRAEAFADVGELRNEVRLAVHIVDSACSYEDVRRVVYGQVRRVYASAGLRPHLKHVYRHPELKNIIMLGREAGTGLDARGDTGVAPTGGGSPPRSHLRVTVNGTEFDVQPSAGHTVEQVTNSLKSQIEGHRDGGSRVFWTRVVERPAQGALGASEHPSRYLLVFTDEDCTQFAEVTDVDSDDADFSAGHPQLLSADLSSMTHDGDSHDHALLKAACHTDFFDGIVIPDFDTSGDSILYGIATWLFKRNQFPPAFIVASGRVTPTPHDDRYTFAHEMGHVIMNCAHCLRAENKEQLMITGRRAEGNAYDVEGRRRIMDAPMKVHYQVARADGTWLGAAADDYLTEIDGSSADLSTATVRCHQFMGSVPTSFGGPTDREPATEW